MDINSPPAHVSLVGFAENNIDAMLAAWKVADGRASIEISSDYQKLDGITRLVSSGLGYFKGSRLLDIGCNSGLHTLVASTVTSTVIGCDQQELFINRAKLARSSLAESGVKLGEVEFACSDFIPLLNRDIDAILAARILYHIGDERLEQLVSVIKKKINKMMIQCRPKRDEKYAPKDVSFTTRYNGLYKVPDCVRFLADCGFEDIAVWGREELWKGGENFPVVFASK